LKKLHFAKRKTISLFLSTILLIGTITTFYPSYSLSINEVNAIPDYKKDKKECINFNLNLNSLDVDVIPESLSNILAEQAQAEGAADIGTGTFGNGEERFGYKDQDFAFVCINNNDNEQIINDNNSPSPPPPTTPITASLTVNKEIYGCANIGPHPAGEGFLLMDCSSLQNSNDPDSGWIQYNDSRISSSSFCRELTENFFDIKVSDDQGNPITEEPIVGSPTGTTIENLVPGTYTVEEIKDPTNNINQLAEYPSQANLCINAGFTDGGQIIIKANAQINIDYILCIEYEDEQNNNCSTITLGAGESRTCTVKNYIRSATDTNPLV
jgi:hypothetical protein